MKISKTTIFRTILIFLVIINIILRKLGFDPLQIGENEIAEFLELIIEICSIMSAWWYNNSFSQNALKAQEYLKELRKEKLDV